MRKKLLAGMLALALCSTNMPLQTIFAEEFTSEAPEETGETPEVFTDENPATTNDTNNFSESIKVSKYQAK